MDKKGDLSNTTIVYILIFVLMFLGLAIVFFKMNSFNAILGG